MYDRVEQLDQSVIQHGPLNKRVYLMKLHPGDVPGIVDKLTNLAVANEYSKIFAKIPLDQAAPFLEAGYVLEATVPGLYQGKTDAAFLGRFLDQKRRTADDPEDIKRYLDLAQAKRDSVPPKLPEGFTLEEATTDDAEEISNLYQQVFETYPFPIHDPKYIAGTMKAHVDYFCIRNSGKIISVSSAEKDMVHACCEMTDFATLPEHRGHGLATILLRHMDRVVPKRGIKTGYTIARAASAGMNITFARCGYQFNGTLIKNTCISGTIESMNVWSRTCSSPTS